MYFHAQLIKCVDKKKVNIYSEKSGRLIFNGIEVKELLFAEEFLKKNRSLLL